MSLNRAARAALVSSDFQLTEYRAGEGHISGTPLRPCTNKLGARLRQLRQERGLTQTELAVALGMQPRYNSRVSTWERGAVLPELSTLFRYANLAEITVSQLLDGVL